MRYVWRRSGPTWGAAGWTPRRCAVWERRCSAPRGRRRAAQQPAALAMSGQWPPPREVAEALFHEHMGTLRDAGCGAAAVLDSCRCANEAHAIVSPRRLLTAERVQDVSTTASAQRSALGCTEPDAGQGARWPAGAVPTALPVCARRPALAPTSTWPPRRPWPASRAAPRMDLWRWRRAVPRIDHRWRDLRALQ